MPRQRAILALLLLLALAISPACRAAEGPSPARELVARVPADSTVQGGEILAELVKLGPAGLGEVVAMLVPPGAGDDSRVRFALGGLAFHVCRPGAEAERAMFARVLVGALQSETPAPVKDFLISLLQLVGRRESVAPLAGLLADPQLCDPATRALTSIGTKEAVGAIAQALPQATGSNRLTLMRALGEARARGAVRDILPHAASEDANTRRVALYALANIGDPAASEAIAKAAQAASPFERSHATALQLLYARRLAERGNRKQCARICRELMQTRSGEEQVFSGALAILVEATGKDALPDVLAALGSESKPIRVGALRACAGLTGARTTRRLVAFLPKAQPEARAELVSALGQRGDRYARRAVLAALKDSEMVVRLAAADAAARFGTPEVTTALLDALKTDQADEIRAIQAALLRLTDARVPAAVAEALPGVPAPARVALLQVLAARRARAHTDTVIALTADKESSVRVAAFRALGQMAEASLAPRLVDLLLKAPAGADQGEAQKAVVMACRRAPDREAWAEPVLAVLPKTTGEQRILLLEVLPQLGGRKALDAVLSDVHGTDAELQEVAVGALAEWEEAAALPELLTLARGAAKPARRVQALRGYVRLAGTTGGPEEKVRLYKEALAVATRPEEKRLVLGAVSGVKHVQALRLAAECLNEEAVRTEAVKAALRIVLPQKEKEAPLRGAEVVELMRRFAAVADPEARVQILGYLEAEAPSDAANLARGKAVTTSVAHQGERKPELAVDGNASDLNSAWFGAKWPCWLRVDLGKPTRLDAAHLFFYWDGGRYYQYTVEVSPDDKNWTRVADASTNTRPATHRGEIHRFAPVEARYVRVNVLKNSANEAVHLVELKLYAPGAGPVVQAPPPPLPPDAEGFVPIFNNKDLTGWFGSVNSYRVENGILICPKDGGGRLLTEKEYADFHLRFEFRLTPGANNGVGIRAPASGDAAYVGMEIQVLDDSAEQYKNLQPYQFHGSIYGVVPAKRGHQKPVGEWNSEEIIARGRQVKVILNGVTIVDANLDEASTPETLDKRPHPGLKNEKGHIGFLGHGAHVEFRNIRIKELPPATAR